MDKANILGIPVDVIDRPALLQRLDELAAAPGVSLVNYVNAHGCNLAASDPAFHEILSASQLVFCDGFGVKVAAKMLGKRLGERMTPPDWIDELFALCTRAEKINAVPLPPDRFGKPANHLGGISLPQQPCVQSGCCGCTARKLREGRWFETLLRLKSRAATNQSCRARHVSTCVRNYEQQEHPAMVAGINLLSLCGTQGDSPGREGKLPSVGCVHPPTALP